MAVSPHRSPDGLPCSPSVSPKGLSPTNGRARTLSSPSLSPLDIRARNLSLSSDGHSQKSNVVAEAVPCVSDLELDVDDAGVAQECSAADIAFYLNWKRASVASYDAAPYVTRDAALGKWRLTAKHIDELLQSMSPSSTAPLGAEVGGILAHFSESSDSDGDWMAGYRCGFMGMAGSSARRACLVASFAFCEAIKFALAERTYLATTIGQTVSNESSDVNTLSVLVTTNLVSCSLGVFLAGMTEGMPAISRLYSNMFLWHSTQVSMLFTLASLFVLLAYKIGTPAAEVVTIGYVYMPLSVVFSEYVFKRRYGRLEWLSVGMMALAILAIVLLREEAAAGHHQRSATFAGFSLVFGAVISSVCASILAEKLLKSRSGSTDNGSESIELPKLPCRSQRRDSFLIQKVRLDFASLLVSTFVWCDPFSFLKLCDRFYREWSHSNQWFGSWGRYQCMMVLVSVCQSWMAGLVTKEFSTVTKAIVQTLTSICMMMFGDWLMNDRFNFQSRELPSLLLAVIAVMSAMIFQTGRLNLQVIRRALKLGPEAEATYNLGSLPLEEQCGATPMVRKNARTAEKEEPVGFHIEAQTGVDGDPLLSEADEERNELGSHDATVSDATVQGEVAIGNSVAIRDVLFSHVLAAMRWLHDYALLLVYVCSDAGRTLVLQQALSTTAINSTSMGLLCYVCGVVVACCLTFQSHGSEGLQRAWRFSEILRCLPAAFLFALATALGNLAFANGITGSLFVVIGKFYTPAAALGARWVLERYYMWLEWFALIILTLSSAAFGYLQSNASTAVDPPVFAMLLVFASATVSALGSLMSEKILKGDPLPFHVQKVRLDFGSIISSILLLPAIGCIATRPQDVPWASRPTSYATCDRESVCWDLRSHTCENPSCTCSCETGVFAGWDLGLCVWVLLLAGAVNTGQGWLVGQVTQRYGVVHRAIADSFSMLAVYFIGDPLLNGTSLGNACLNLVAFIVPLSTATFTVGASEMQKVFEAEGVVDHHVRSRSKILFSPPSEPSGAEAEFSIGASSGTQPTSEIVCE